jgi:hypothetical protein
MTRLTTVSNSIDATLLQHRLERAGIRSFVTNENISAMLPHFNGILGQGIQVMVGEEDYEKARAILAIHGNAMQVEKCPFCGSTNIGFGMRGKNRWGDRILVFISLLFAVPFGNIKNKYYCKACKEDFE